MTQHYAIAALTKHGPRRVYIDANGRPRWTPGRGHVTASELRVIRNWLWTRYRIRRTRAVALKPKDPYPHVYGDRDCDAPLLAALERVAQRLTERHGRTIRIRIRSGKRSYAEQAALYQAYLNGTGNLAARPGTSLHETGNAADCEIDGLDIGDFPGAVDACAAEGVGFPVDGEDWHVELSTSMAGAND